MQELYEKSYESGKFAYKWKAGDLGYCGKSQNG
jgi:hypothetical protein